MPCFVIISATRRADLPALYGQWFLNRVRAGWCSVPNPFNPAQVSRISMAPEDVDCFVFWTRFSRPMFAYLDELDQRGHRYYFMITLLGYPRPFTPHGPALEAAVAAFQELSRRIGPDRVVWRYDPIVHTSATDAAWHLQTFGALSSRLAGYTRRCVISLMLDYKKIRPRMAALAREGYPLRQCGEEFCNALLPAMVDMGARRGMRLQSCATEVDLEPYGVVPGKCIDEAHLLDTFGLRLPAVKDPHQRKLCRCIPSRDIGMYDGCVFGCRYCYATADFQRARANRKAHDPASPSMLGWSEPPGPTPTGQISLFK